nr:hypothetical protein [uncultured Flavobacterium sp.]
MTIKHKIIYIIIFFSDIFLFSQKNKNPQNFSNNFHHSENHINNKLICDSLTGTYTLESCENSRFQIIINKKQSEYFYIISDNNKTIVKGKAKITDNEKCISIMLGLIGGIFSGKDIQIQNYGNEMNQFIHFTQCDEKYLTFVKK